GDGPARGGLAGRGGRGPRRRTPARMMPSSGPPRPPGGGQDTRVLLEALAAVFGSGTLKESMTVGAGLLAHVLSSEQAAVFLADGEEPLREYWHSKVPEVRERIRATFKATALEAVRA